MLLLGSLSLGASCGDDGSDARPVGGLEAPFARVERLDPAFLDPSAERPVERTVFSQRVSGGALDWKIHPDDCQVRMRSSPEGERFAVLIGDGPKRVEIPGPFEPGAFQRVVLRVASPRRDTVRARLTDGEREWAQSTRVALDDADGLQDVILDFRPDLDTTVRTAAVILLFEGRSRQVSLASVRLVHRPLLRLLPTPDEGLGLIDIGGEARHGLGVFSGLPMVCELDVQSDMRLEFDHGIPFDGMEWAERPELRVRLESEGNLLATHALELPASGWEHASIDLRGLEGRRVEAIFEVPGDEESELLCALSQPYLARPGRDAPTPTVVLVTSDTHRADHVGVAGAGVEIQTPFLDALARRGLMFEDCFSSSNVTRPSHAALLTGYSPRDTGVINNTTTLSEEAPTLAERFRDAGWLTYAAVSALPLHHRHSGLAQGFDRMASPTAGTRDADESVATLRRWLGDADGVPLFVWLHVFDAHSPYQVPEDLERLYWDGDVDPRSETLPELPPRKRPKWDERLRDLDYVMAQYRSEVTYLDRCLAPFFELPRFEKAVLAVTADHGENLGNHELWFNHHELYPDTVHVPLLLAGPGVPAGRREERPVQNIDIGRTLLDLAGLEAVEFPGTSLLSSDALAAPGPRFGLSHDALSASVSLADHLLILQVSVNPVNAENPEHKLRLHSVELYDLSSDPQCKEDLTEKEPETARRLRQLLVRWLTAAPEDRWADRTEGHDAGVIEGLAALGYVDDGGPAASGAWFDAECGCKQCNRWR